MKTIGPSTAAIQGDFENTFEEESVKAPCRLGLATPLAAMAVITAMAFSLSPASAQNPFAQQVCKNYAADAVQQYRQMSQLNSKLSGSSKCLVADSPRWTPIHTGISCRPTATNHDCSPRWLSDAGNQYEWCMANLAHPDWRLAEYQARRAQINSFDRCIPG